jgi:pimeloyl-ACP methyl ester carboxylesterase
MPRRRAGGRSNGWRPVSTSSPIEEPHRAELVELNRTRLRLWCWGDPEAPLVLCLHGAYDHGRMFDELAPALADLGHHVVAVDLRGHGDSGPLDTGFAWSLLHLDLALLIQHLGHGPVGIVAHSFGGGQATGVAGAFPELVRWIVNIDGLGPPSAGLAPPADIPAAVQQSFARTDRALLDHPRPWASVEEMAARRGRTNPRLPARWTLHLARHGARAVEGGWAWKADPMFGIGMPSEFNLAMLEAEMRSATCPVLVLTGDQEDTWRELGDDELATRVGWLGARHVVVPGTGHYVHLEDPTATLTAIEAFLAEVGP